MFSQRKKYEVTNPGFYDQLISDQKRQVCKNKADPDAWIELGRLFEVRAAYTNEFVNKKFFLQYSFFITLLLSIGGLFLFNFSFQHLLTSEFHIIATLLFAIGMIFMWNIRYPKSGKYYFKKAVSLDPNCGEAYMYLGKIALRKYQKRKACQLFEMALQLDVKNWNRIKSELKTIYEKEFVDFFNDQSEKEIRQQKIIDSQLDKIRILHRQNVGFQRKNERLNNKIEQIKWEAGHQVKLLSKETEQDISLIRQQCEEQITNLKQEIKDEAKEMAELKFIRLTTEIMESKSSLGKQSFAVAVQTVENIIGSHFWQMLPKQVQIYLATAEQIYTVLKNQNEKSDYGLVGMELCKALETMLNQILVEPFVKYIQNNQAEFLRVNQVGEKHKKPVYFTYLSMVVDQLNYPEVNSLTLGQYLFVLSRTLENDYALQEYAYFLDKKHTESENIIGKDFLNRLETVTRQYRNTIAHRSPMDKEQYEHLRQLVLVGKDSLLINLRARYA